jgi:hypothetical protein
MTVTRRQILLGCVYSAVHGFWPVESSDGRIGASHQYGDKRHVWSSPSLCLPKYSWPCHAEMPGNIHHSLLHHARQARPPTPLAPPTNNHALHYNINSLNAELTPIYHLLALLGVHHILHVSGVRVNGRRRSGHQYANTKPDELWWNKFQCVISPTVTINVEFVRSVVIQSV